jgi:hypothetical protein
VGSIPGARAEGEVITADARSLIDGYIQRGFSLVFYPTKLKGPPRVKASKGWTTKLYTPADYKDGDNVGIKTGTEIAPGRYLVDIDFDCPESLHLADRFLPSTQFGVGRAGRQISHAFYTTEVPVVTEQYQDVVADAKGKMPTLVELRGTKKDGTVGLQTMVAPSVHPTGEVIELRMSGDIADVTAADISKAMRHLATACILARHLGTRGTGHDVRMALAGFLRSLDLERADAECIARAVAHRTHNDEQDTATTVASTYNRAADAPTTGAPTLAEALGEHGRKVIAQVRRWFGVFTKTDKGGVRADDLGNIEHALVQLGVTLRFNSFTQRPEVVRHDAAPARLEDAIVDALWFEIESAFKFRPSPEFFTKALQHLARQNAYHPVLDYLSALEWDRVPRLDGWLTTYGGAQASEYTRAVGALPLIAAVRRVRVPGAKFDEMLVLESGQGKLKSSALRVLCPSEEWFSDDLPMNTDAKQVIERTLGKWLIESSDLHGLRASQVEHLKANLSRRVDGPVRLAYGRLPTEVPRQFILIGTTNTFTNYLRDSTGARRFWPVRVQEFDIDALRRDRDQLWAEAAAREAGGASIRLDPSLYAVAGAEQEQRRAVDEWEEIIDDLLGGPVVRVQDIWAALELQASQRDNRHAERVAAIMQRRGYSTKRKMRVRSVDPDNKPAWYWLRDDTETAEPVRLLGVGDV